MLPTIGKAALGLYLSGVGLESLLDELTAVGFSTQDVCVMLPQGHPAARAMVSSNSRATTGGSEANSEAADWFAQFGAVIIPGVGAVVAGSEFVGVLFGTASDDIACENALHGLGLPAPQAERYQGWVRGGGVIVYVACHNEEQIHHAIEVLEEEGAEEVSALESSGDERRVSVVPLLKAS